MSVFLRDLCINKFDGHNIVAYPELSFDISIGETVTSYSYHCSRCWTTAEEISNQGPKRSRSPNKPKTPAAAGQMQLEE